MTAPARARFLDLAAMGRAEPAVKLARELVADGMSVDRLIVDVLAPTQHQVGLLWQSNRWSISDEHAATAAVDAALGAAALATVPLPSRGAILVACVEEEYHTLPARMGAERLRQDGWSVTFMGANVSAEELQRAAAVHTPHAVVLSCTVPLFLFNAARCITAVAEVDIPVVTAGIGFGEGPLLSQRLGASARIDAADDPTAVLGTQLRPATAISERLVAATRIELAILALQDECMAQMLVHLPAVATYTPAQREHTSADVAYILRYLAVATGLDEASIFSSFVAWLTEVLASRGLPASVLPISLNAIADVTRGAGLTSASELCSSAAKRVAAA